jgi:hypothetical protein
LGDVTLLPSDLPFSSKTAIAQTFGPEFADERRASGCISSACQGARLAVSPS